MSDDQSFYEIQLNTPHLVLAFLGAAVVGVTVFWLGVVIGRGQTEPGPADQWQAAVPAEGTEEEPFEFYEAVSEPTLQPEALAETAVAPTESPAPPEAGQPSSAAAPGFEPADPVDEELAPVVAESAVGLPRADASLPSGWIVQVRSTPGKPDADSLQAALVAAGFPAFVVSVDVDGVTWYRVRVGRYRSQGEASIVEAELVTRSDVDSTWVTEG
jgi:cell division protein FtsN